MLTTRHVPTGDGDRRSTTAVVAPVLLASAVRETAASVTSEQCPQNGQNRPPSIDLTKIIMVGELVLGAVAVASRLAARPPGPKAIVRMGPGGWVSVKDGGVRLNGRLFQPGKGSDRPRWARLLHAHRAT